MDIHIRPIQASDNARIASIIRAALREFGADKPGTVYYDETTDDLYTLFRKGGSAYFIAEYQGVVVGGAGIYPTEGLPDGVCELVKMYLSPEARGKGIARLLVNRAEQAARANGFDKIYLESMPELSIALAMYEKMGFRYLDSAMGNSGHTGCDRWMIKSLT
ncbi:MAG: GNAT family N-acetyltransferase [Saprospiraceae bacterium]|nr:GNAT family N-acetyltransferase [Saprospiraceae bacterium]